MRLPTCAMAMTRLVDRGRAVEDLRGPRVRCRGDDRGVRRAGCTRAAPGRRPEWSAMDSDHHTAEQPKTMAHAPLPPVMAGSRRQRVRSLANPAEHHREWRSGTTKSPDPRPSGWSGDDEYAATDAPGGIHSLGFDRTARPGPARVPDIRRAPTGNSRGSRSPCRAETPPARCGLATTSGCCVDSGSPCCCASSSASARLSRTCSGRPRSTGPRPRSW